MLGGQSVLGRLARDSMSLADEVRRGLDRASLLAVKQHSGLTDRELAAVLGLSEKTIQRLKDAGDRRLDLVTSDRLYRVARLFALAESALESVPAAHAWMHAPQMALGERVPIELLQTEIGAREVEDLLGRIEHGVFS